MSYFPELHRSEKIAEFKHPLFESKILAEVEGKNGKLPIYGFVIGTKNKKLPTFGLSAGVHGLEKIGTHVVLHFLECIIEQLKWDEELQARFEKCRIACLPIVNPYGVLHNTRSNANGVDIMRNAPVESEEDPPFVLGGHYISNKIPYFRGNPDKMEVETATLIQFIKDELFESEFSMALDVHSGFGTYDRLWYPYAKTTRPFPLLDKSLQFKNLFEISFPNHVYKIEPQSLSYTTHGDLWDLLFDTHFEKNQGKDSVFLPWALEMGSWLWVKKNPKQLFSAFGIFNPLKPHRYKRIMRRHYILLDFFMRSIQSYKNWMKE